ncbi:MAG: DUF6482 family protein [Marinobacter sp.]
MHMTLGELKSRKHELIRLAEIVSMEGRYYMVRFYIGSAGFILVNEQDKIIMFSGACAAREALRDFIVAGFDLIPPTGTDEMIGMPDSSSEPMRVQF